MTAATSNGGGAIMSLRPAPDAHGELSPIEFTNEKVELLKRTFCKGATNDELELFLHACKRTGLDPFMRQIHAVKRYQDGREVMTVQTGIDGYRLIADRTNRYMPGREPTFDYNEDGQVVRATAYVKKMDSRGEWHEVAASAYFDEYAGKKKGGELTAMWASKPHIMLGKCAEALALRRAFPAELSGVYTKEEMEQASAAANQPAPAKQPPERIINPETGEDLGDLMDDSDFRLEVMRLCKLRQIEDADVAAGLMNVEKEAGRQLAEWGPRYRRGLLAGIGKGKADKWKGMSAKVGQPLPAPQEPAATDYVTEALEQGDEGTEPTEAEKQEIVIAEGLGQPWPGWGEFIVRMHRHTFPHVTEEQAQRALVNCVVGAKAKNNEDSVAPKVRRAWYDSAVNGEGRFAYARAKE